MAGQTAFEKKIQTGGRLGPAGMDCPCCGPAPKHRRKWERAGRRKAKTFWTREVSKEIAEARAND